MALEGAGRYYAPQTSRSLIRVAQSVAKDSAFPFQPGDDLVVRIDPKARRLIIERA